MNSLLPLLPDGSFPPGVDGDDCEVVAADLQLHTRFSFRCFEDLIKVVPNVVKKRQVTVILGILCYAWCHHWDIGGKLLVVCHCLATNVPVG